MISPPAIPRSLSPARTSRLAVTSLVLGICVLLTCGLTGLPALAFGIAALVAINRSRGQLVGRGMAIAGVCLGAVSFPLIMMGLLFPATSAVKHQANRAKAAATISHLVTASTAYYNDYGKWPEPRNPAELVIILNGGSDPISGRDVPDAVAQNPRRTVFMEFRVKDLVSSSSSAPGTTGDWMFVDPWGTPYAFCFDNGKPGFAEGCSWKDQTAYDNIIPKPYSDSTPGTTINAGCAFFTNGPDRRTGNQPSNPRNQASQMEAYEDDIRSWK